MIQIYVNSTLRPLHHALDPYIYKIQDVQKIVEMRYIFLMSAYLSQ